MTFLDRGVSSPLATGGSLTEIISQLKFLVQNVAQIQQAIINVAPRTFGTFTLSAASATVIPQTSTQSMSVIDLMPTNAAAATLMGAATSLYVSARTEGTSFTVTTANGAAAVGTETFAYVLWNPA